MLAGITLDGCEHMHVWILCRAFRQIRAPRKNFSESKTSNSTGTRRRGWYGCKISGLALESIVNPRFVCGDWLSQRLIARWIVARIVLSGHLDVLASHVPDDLPRGTNTVNILDITVVSVAPTRIRVNATSQSSKSSKSSPQQLYRSHRITTTSDHHSTT